MVDAPVTIDFLRADGTSVVVNRTLAPLSRTTIAVDEVPGLESTALSTRVTSTGGVPIVVERTMRWDASGYGAHTEKATAGTASEWYFAEGRAGLLLDLPAAGESARDGERRARHVAARERAGAAA